MTDSPPIQYAKTSDGVNIAYWTYGQGPPLVLMPLLIGSHVQIDWSIPSRRNAFERLAAGATIIRYDTRGMGMSDRQPIDFSPEAGVRDLEAVVEKLGLEHFAILSQQVTGDTGLHFAATNPERVSAVVHRVVLAAQTRSDTLRRINLIRPLMEEDWDLYTQIFGRLLAGWNDADSGVLGGIICSSHTPASYSAARRHVMANPSGEWLAKIQAPVLLIHGIGEEEEGSTARQMASAIGNCRVLAIPRLGYASTGESLGGPYPNEVGLAAILDFIAEPETAKVEVRMDTGLRTILFTDLVEHTQMMTRLGDEKGREVLRDHERITREALRAHGGSEVKSMGDGFMASFTSVTKAVECAISLQQAFHGNENGLRVRIGLNAGEPVEDEGDLFGSTVILAARIAAIASAGEILVSDVIRQLLTGKAFMFADHGEHVLKGFEDPVRVFAVRWE